MEGGMNCVKYLLFFFNLMFSVCGLSLTVMGVMFQVSLHHTVTVKDPIASGAPIAMASIGVLTSIIAFFGCCGAWREGRCMLSMFSFLLSIIIIAEIGAAIAGNMFRAKVTTVVHESLTQLVDEYQSSSENIRHTVDELQQNLKCCGVNSSSDWTLFGPDGQSVPDSCCVTVTTSCGNGTMMDAASVHTRGCHAALQALMESNVLWVVITTLGIAFLQMLGIALAYVLMKGIAKNQRANVA